MTPVVRLQAAIDKLEQLRAETRYIEVNGWIVEENPGDTSRYPLEPRDDLFPITNDELIVTLHRTIDAQLAILREAVFQLSGAPQARGFIGNEFSLFMALADAILGEAS